MTETTTASVSSTYGVHSEVGRLRKVLVCAPGLAHRRLTPSNNDELLFDDVMWVENAQRDHADFVNKLTQRGVEVVELHDLLAADDGGRRPRATGCSTARSSPTTSGSAWSTRPARTSSRCDRASSPSTSSAAWPPATCPRTTAPTTSRWRASRPGSREYLMPPLPNTLYTRDTTCWLYGGLTMNPLYWPARKDETLHLQGDLRVPPRLRRLDGLVGRPGARLGRRRRSRAATSCRSATASC